MNEEIRRRRLHLNDRSDDERTRYQRDRDRILYTSALRRLAGTTQVVSEASGRNFHLSHNRLTHTLEVAQIARRTAEYQTKSPAKLLRAVGGLDPDVTEAAAFAHDLGHPPFGHIGEQALDEVMIANGDSDGYEGNAQVFRILTKLSLRDRAFRGLNLTVATLNGTMKYPWPRDKANPGTKEYHKFGYYESEKEIFDDVRTGYKDRFRTAEAEIMDWADEIAYAVHDLYDFARVGLIPIHDLASSKEVFAKFITKVKDRWQQANIKRDYTDEEMQKAFGVLSICPLDHLYEGSRNDRADLRSFTSSLIGQYVNAVQLTDPRQNDGKCIRLERAAKIELDVLKECTWIYVIQSSGLVSVQYGQARMLKELFNILLEDAQKGARLLPVWAKELLEEDEKPTRVIADVVSGLAEDQAQHLFRRLTGQDLGQALDQILI